MAKETRKRYHMEPGTTHPQYLAVWRAKHKRGEMVDDPPHDEVEVVETEAWINGEPQTIKVYKDQVKEYEKVYAEAKQAAEAEEEEK